ncbi:hypothetical protein INS49_007805 [Diaporthe citri]|uniref:uncharacterized protein n=1 Tax=Diaporthe citri TaxID=83186 RepID=UPI001C7F03F8|nr:uncharacterized protein INS49_007805 [Diaporthe citri]KAG6362712.1 hypothetical protein INS49_007805 [Diaporthe citri]
MAHPYKANDEDKDGDEDLKDLDPAVAEDMAFAKALQNSLEEQGKDPKDDTKVPNYTRESPDDTGEVPQFSFTAEEIAQDDQRREEDLYGPPSPLKESRAATLLTLETTSANSSVKDASNHVANDTTAKNMAKSDVAAKEAPSAPKIKNDPFAERVLAIKIAMLLSTVECPSAYHEALQENMSSFEGSEGAVAAAAAAAAAEAEPGVEATEGPADASRSWNSPSSSTAGVAGSDPGQASPGQSADMATGHDQTPTSSQVLVSPDAADAAVNQAALEAIETSVKEETGTAVAGSSAYPEGFSSALDDVVALSVDHDADESGRGQHFDDEVARTHAARLTTIEALLANDNALLEAALSARLAGRTTGGTSAAFTTQAARNQIAPAGPSHQEAGGSTGDEEMMDWLLDEFAFSPRPGPEQEQSPRHRSQPQ